MRFRIWVGRITSPFFVPLRRFIAWADEQFGTCDHQLILQPRPCFVEFRNEVFESPKESLNLLESE